MEIIGSSRGLNDLYVGLLQDLQIVIDTIIWHEFVLVGEEKVSFGSAGGMLWAVAVIPVR